MTEIEEFKTKIKTKAHNENSEPQDIMQMYFLKDYYIEYLLVNINIILF